MSRTPDTPKDTIQLLNTAKPASGLKPGIYKHYKGQFYQVIDVAQHSENNELLVVYRALYGEYGLWVRPLTMFTESVTTASQGTVPRFSWHSEA